MLLILMLKYQPLHNYQVMLQLVQEQRQHDLWGAFCEELLQGLFEWPKAGGHDDQGRWVGW